MLLKTLPIAIFFLSRTKAQNSATLLYHNEMESLRKECEAAKKKAQKTLEKYSLECNRLKVIIGEQQGIN